MILLDSLFIAYMFTGILYYLFESVMEIKRVVDMCKEGSKETDERLIDLKNTLADLESILGTSAVLLIYCFVVLISELKLIFIWPKPVFLDMKAKVKR